MSRISGSGSAIYGTTIGLRILRCASSSTTFFHQDGSGAAASEAHQSNLGDTININAAYFFGAETPDGHDTRSCGKYDRTHQGSSQKRVATSIAQRYSCLAAQDEARRCIRTSCGVRDTGAQQKRIRAPENAGALPQPMMHRRRGWVLDKRLTAQVVGLQAAETTLQIHFRYKYKHCHGRYA
jgi:hypothetical protein